jgi:septum formation protein
LKDRYLLVLASGSPRRRELLDILGIPFVVILPEASSSVATSTGNNEDKISPPLTEGGIDESPLPGETPADLVQRLSRTKATAVANRLALLGLPDIILSSDNPQARRAIIIAADTVVVLENKILGKPVNPTEATQMLRSLRNHHYHYVYSGLTVGVWQTSIQAGEKLSRSQNAGQMNGLSSKLYTLELLTRLHQSKVWMRAYTDAEIDAYVANGDPMDKAGAYAIQNNIFAPVEQLDGCFASVMGLPLGELAAALNDVGIPLPEIGPLCSEYSGYPCCLNATNR